MTGSVCSVTGQPAWRLWLPAALTILLTGASPASTATAPRQAQEREIARCVRQAARGKLWLERTLWVLRDKEAGWIGAEVRNANGTHDLGPLQINSWWVPRIAVLVVRPADHVRYWLRFDPCFNAEAARWIFLSGLSQTHDYWTAVGAYHSPTPWRQRAYALDVASRLAARFGSEAFSIRRTIRSGSKDNPAISVRRKGGGKWE